MKILVLNANFDEYALGWSYKRAFESLGHDVSMINPGERLAEFRLWNNRYSRRLLERPLLQAFNKRWLPELLDRPADVIWVGKGAWALPQFWRAFKEARPNTKLVCFNGDDPLTTFSRGGNRTWITESISCYDLFCTYKSSLVEPLLQAGAKQVECVPFGWDPSIHPMQPYGNFQYDLLFIGNGDEHRSKWLTEILSNPVARNWKTAIFGYWPKKLSKPFSKSVHNRQLVSQKMAQTVAASKVTLNILRIQNEGSHNMRTFETPGCGGLLATQFSEEQHFFLGGGHNEEQGAIFFDNANDAAVKLSHAIHEDDFRQTIINASRKKIQQHTYKQRAKQTLDAIWSASDHNGT
ncbi:CgeB family protein [Rosistilla oblonga]|uniref:Spore protein YkvP/CgeB glycosyl transferase-like domain-containing protein n=1 Tax=Rosistilla oblonga TaxID=2527990 RepID=A0A518J1V7_9BACT|nr:glycosyltransferase [Rosistilla oblonga]QDV59322.1 hypothetical protein Mal33_53500 [Rosistilla oblonga]